MFHQISESMRARMRYLERVDAADRVDGTARDQRLRQVPPVTGQFLAILVAQAPEGEILEIGTSAGYSTMWLSLGAATSGRLVTTFELLDTKVSLAKETFAASGITDKVRLVQGDARQCLETYARAAFCFLDINKDLYQECYDLVIPRLVAGGILVADNAIDHKMELQGFIDSSLADSRVDAMVVPVGNGLLLARKV